MKNPQTIIKLKEGVIGKMKIEINTLSDYNYLTKGLTLYRSLIKTGSDFRLNYLCLDSMAYEKLMSLNLENINPVLVDHIIENDDVAKSLQKSNRWLFCMSMASYFSKHLLNTGIDSITYIDSDIYFHKSINELFDRFDGKEIAIFRHRQFPLDTPRPEGWFNVGVVFFRNSKFGKRVLDWWADAVINQKYPELASCGDQKYLDRFMDLCPEELIFIDKGIGHGAPWQWQLYNLNKFETEGTIEYEGENQILFFTHFSQFSSDFEKDTYVPSTMHHIYTPLNDYKKNGLKKIYDEYFSELKITKKLYSIK